MTDRNVVLPEPDGPNNSTWSLADKARSGKIIGDAFGRTTDNPMVVRSINTSFVQIKNQIVRKEAVGGAWE